MATPPEVEFLVRVDIAERIERMAGRHGDRPFDSRDLDAAILACAPGRSRSHPPR